MSHNPALDGIRALAIVLVLLFHARAPAFSGGFLGVDVFFVLSGYLITEILLSELRATGRIRLCPFFLRRFARLTPALLLMLGVYLVLAPHFWPSHGAHGLNAGLAALYVADYAVAYWGVPDLLSHTWSLAVEHHFYLLWPFVILWGSRRWDARSLVIALFTLFIIATFWRWTSLIRGDSWEQVYYRFDTRVSGLALGGSVAAVLRVPHWDVRIDKALPWGAWSVVVALICLQFRWHDFWMLTWGVLFAEVAAAIVILMAVRSRGVLHQALALRPVVWIGQLSYGVYLWHYPIFRYLRETVPWDQVLWIGTPIAFACALLSFHTVERWARVWGAKGRAAIGIEAAR